MKKSGILTWEDDHFGRGVRMQDEDILKDKKILIVDDEPDVLETLTELLDMCLIDTAPDFETAKKFLSKNAYDAAILDIMGVRGYDLLQLTTHNGTPTLMLTAHALDEESLKKSAEDGAAYFAPKDKMHEIDLFVADVLDALQKKKSTWDKFFERLAGYYDKRFHGTNWRVQEKAFWKDKLSNWPDV